jgi:predicted DNA binding CopG/RHH family protein
MIRCNFFLPPRVVEALKQHAVAEGSPMSEHVRRALSEYLKRQEQK